MRHGHGLGVTATPDDPAETMPHVVSEPSGRVGERRGQKDDRTDTVHLGLGTEADIVSLAARCLVDPIARDAVVRRLLAVVQEQILPQERSQSDERLFSVVARLCLYESWTATQSDGGNLC